MSHRLKERRCTFADLEIREGWFTKEIASRITDVITTHHKIVRSNTQIIEKDEDQWIAARDKMSLGKLDAAFNRL